MAASTIWPADFSPKQNPFYVALSWRNELKGRQDGRSGLDPLLKNRWVEIERDGRSCFAQRQDAGPCDEDDLGFVFGNAHKPRNTFDAKAASMSRRRSGIISACFDNDAAG